MNVDLVLLVALLILVGGFVGGLACMGRHTRTAPAREAEAAAWRAQTIASRLWATPPSAAHPAQDQKET